MPKDYSVRSLPIPMIRKDTFVPDPYRSKAAFFYREGDDRFKPVRIVINSKRYPTISSLMTELNIKVPLTRGVRAIFSPKSERRIVNVDQIVQNGRYICSSSVDYPHILDINRVTVPNQPWKNVNNPVLSFAADDSRFIRTGLPSFEPSDDDADYQQSKKHKERYQQYKNLDIRRSQEEHRSRDFSPKSISTSHMDKTRNEQHDPSWAERIRRIVVFSKC